MNPMQVMAVAQRAEVVADGAELHAECLCGAYLVLPARCTVEQLMQTVMVHVAELLDQHPAELVL